jgi:hypothetical protein
MMTLKSDEKRTCLMERNKNVVGEGYSALVTECLASYVRRGSRRASHVYLASLQF